MRKATCWLAGAAVRPGEVVMAQPDRSMRSRSTVPALWRSDRRRPGRPTGQQRQQGRSTGRAGLPAFLFRASS